MFSSQTTFKDSVSLYFIDCYPPFLKLQTSLHPFANFPICFLLIQLLLSTSSITLYIFYILNIDILARITMQNKSAMQSNDADFIPDEVNYFRIYSNNQHFQRTYDKLSGKDVQVQSPYILTYQNDQTTFHELAERYIDERKMKVAANCGFFKLINFTPVRFKDVQQLKNGLENDQLRGLELIFSAAELKTQSMISVGESESTHEDQSNLCFSLKNYQKYGVDKTFQLCFLFVGNQGQNLYLKVLRNSSIHSLKTEIRQKLFQFYALKLKEDQFKFINLKKKVNQISKVQDIFKNYDLVQIQFSMKNIKLNANKQVSHKYFYIETKPGDSFKLIYDEVKQLKVETLLEKLHIDGIQKNTCLKFFDKILKPFQKIQEAEDIMKLGTYSKNITAQVMREKYDFYANLQNFQDFDCKKIVLDQNNLKVLSSAQVSFRNELVKRCLQIAQLRVKTKNQKELSEHFKCEEDIHPIIFYTSSIEIITRNGKVNILYKELNEFLRNQYFSKERFQNIKDKWEYRYTKTLIQKLLAIPNSKETVYRGVSFKTFQKVGQIIQFKNFTSTSTNQEVALHFAKQGTVGTVYKIHELVGRYISKYSVYAEQEEILLLPYSRFEVISIQDQVFPKKVELREVGSLYFSERTVNIILWVDDKTEEGRVMFESIKDTQISTTFLFQLISNQDLKEWLQTYKKYINAENIRIIMITNMKRVENGKEDKEAGATTINIIRKFIPNIPIYVYIGYIPATEEILNKSQIHRLGLHVGNHGTQVRNFLIAFCKPRNNSLIETEKFKSENENWADFHKTVKK